MSQQRLDGWEKSDDKWELVGTIPGTDYDDIVRLGSGIRKKKVFTYEYVEYIHALGGATFEYMVCAKLESKNKRRKMSCDTHGPIIV